MHLGEGEENLHTYKYIWWKCFVFISIFELLKKEIAWLLNYISLCEYTSCLVKKSVWLCISMLCYIVYYSKTVLWFFTMHKEGNELCIMYPLIYGSVLQVRAYYFYSPRNQTTSCQYKLSKTTCAAHYRGTIGQSKYDVLSQK